MMVAASGESTMTCMKLTLTNFITMNLEHAGLPNYRIAGNIGGKNIWRFLTDLNIGDFNFGGVTMDCVSVHMM